MASEIEKMRPNIRVEIHNNLANSMEVDVEKSENEEGEISEEENEDSNNLNKIIIPKITPKPASNMIWANTKAIFTTGINIFDKEEQGKLQERAKRFALKPNEIHNFTDEDLQYLYDSLGITQENKNNLRFEAVLIQGKGEMNVEDILEYFGKYAPAGIEWISDDSCNVTWLDNVSAARAIYYSSKAIKGMPVRGVLDPFAKDFVLDDETEFGDELNSGKSILLKNHNREIELKIDNDMGIDKPYLKDAVDLSEIHVPIPPGYWRLGNKHTKSRCILLRFAFKTDKQPYKIENFGKYYKKFGTKGLIADTKKKQLRSIFERNKEFNQEKNPWGVLAKNWDEDAKFREREHIIPNEPKVEIKSAVGVLGRLGMKRKLEESEDEIKEIEETEVEEEQENPKKKLKIPRMRMYADEEEEKQKRKKILQKLKRQTEKIQVEEEIHKADLRNVLGLTNRKPVVENVIDLEPETIDLGSKLKNRNRKMVFTVEREEDELENYPKSDVVHADIRSLLEERRAKSPMQIRRHSPEVRRRSPEIRRSRRTPERRRRTPERPRRSLHSRRRSPVRRRRSPTIGGLHSDRMLPKRSYSDYSDNEVKPRSKVAVVIKTQKKPTVASTIWARDSKQSDSESSSEESESEESVSTEESSSSESEASSDAAEESIHINPHRVKTERPGFSSKDIKSRLIMQKSKHISPLKIEISNDHFRNK